MYITVLSSFNHIWDILHRLQLMPTKANMKIRPAAVELITCGPYEGHTDITKVKDAFRDYPNMPVVNGIDSF